MDGWMDGQLAGWSDRQTDARTDRQAGRQTDRQNFRFKDWQTKKITDLQTTWLTGHPALFPCDHLRKIELLGGKINGMICLLVATMNTENNMKEEEEGEGDKEMGFKNHSLCVALLSFWHQWLLFSHFFFSLINISWSETMLVIIFPNAFGICKAKIKKERASQGWAGPSLS